MQNNQFISGKQYIGRPYEADGNIQYAVHDINDRIDEFIADGYNVLDANIIVSHRDKKVGIFGSNSERLEPEFLFDITYTNEAVAHGFYFTYADENIDRVVEFTSEVLDKFAEVGIAAHVDIIPVNNEVGGYLQVAYITKLSYEDSENARAFITELQEFDKNYEKKIDDKFEESNTLEDTDVHQSNVEPVAGTANDTHYADGAVHGEDVEARADYDKENANADVVEEVKSTTVYADGEDVEVVEETENDDLVE